LVSFLHSFYKTHDCVSISCPLSSCPFATFRFRHFYRLNEKTKTKSLMNVYFQMSVMNTSFIDLAWKYDPRLRPLLMFLRYWSKNNCISGGGKGSKITSYAYSMLVFFYLQTENLFPSVKEFQASPPPYFRALFIKLHYFRTMAHGRISICSCLDELLKPHAMSTFHTRSFL
jgi:hypothetical protein